MERWLVESNWSDGPQVQWMFRVVYDPLLHKIFLVYQAYQYNFILL